MVTTVTMVTIENNYLGNRGLTIVTILFFNLKKVTTVTLSETYGTVFFILKKVVTVFVTDNFLNFRKCAYCISCNRFFKIAVERVY